MNRIKKGDQVIVITGKDKGRQGTVLNIADDKVLVEAVNMAKNKGDRVGIKILDDGRKVRYFKSNGEVVDV
jgi:large subunit ribosomal protein L24